MFEDSLIESGGRLKTHRGMTAAFSFGFQILLVGFLILIPLLVTEALPKQQLTTFLVAPPPPPPPPPPAAPVHIVRQVQTDIVNGQLRTPTKIPQKVQMIKEDAAPPPMSGMGVAGGIPGGAPGGVIGGIISSTNVAVPKVAAPQRIRVSSGVSAGNLIRKVTPQYPPIARTAHIQGNVVLEAEISKEGNVTNLHVISGPPLLQQAAIEAVKQWKYRPYLLNGEPVVVDTQVTVIFSFGS
jgi:periplasmic protein TonB